MVIMPDPVPCSSDDVLSDTLGIYLSSEYLFFFFDTRENMCVHAQVEVGSRKGGRGRWKGAEGKGEGQAHSRLDFMTLRS